MGNYNCRYIYSNSRDYTNCCDKCESPNFIGLKSDVNGTYYIGDGYSYEYVTYRADEKNKYSHDAKLCENCINEELKSGYFYVLENQKSRCLICMKYPSLKDLRECVHNKCNKIAIINNKHHYTMAYMNCNIGGWSCSFHIGESSKFRESIQQLKILPKQLIGLIDEYIVKYKSIKYKCYVCNKKCKYFTDKRHYPNLKDKIYWNKRINNNNYYLLDNSPEYWDGDFTGLCAICDGSYGNLFSIGNSRTIYNSVIRIIIKDYTCGKLYKDIRNKSISNLICKFAEEYAYGYADKCADGNSTLDIKDIRKSVNMFIEYQSNL